MVAEPTPGLIHLLKGAYKSSCAACRRKSRFPRRKAALGAAAIAAKREGRGIYVYRCPACFKWHLTSRPKENAALYSMLLLPEYRELIWEVPTEGIDQ